MTTDCWTTSEVTSRRQNGIWSLIQEVMNLTHFDFSDRWTGFLLLVKNVSLYSYFLDVSSCVLLFFSSRLSLFVIQKPFYPFHSLFTFFFAVDFILILLFSTSPTFNSFARDSFFNALYSLMLDSLSLLSSSIYFHIQVTRTLESSTEKEYHLTAFYVRWSRQDKVYSFSISFFFESETHDDSTGQTVMFLVQDNFQENVRVSRRRNCM